MSSIVTEQLLTPSGPHVRHGHKGAAVLMLALCCVFWGFSFPSMQMLTESWDRGVPASLRKGPLGGIALRATFLGWRFALAGLLYWMLTRPRQRGYSSADIRGGLVVGSLMAVGMILQLMGLRYTLPSVSAFITALAVVFGPLGQGFILRQRVSGRIWLAVALAIAGTFLLSQRSDSGAETLAAVPPVPYLGEILTAAGAIIFTCQILAVDRMAPKADVARLTCIMLITVGVLNAAGGAALAGQSIYRLGVLKGLVLDHTFLWVMPALIIFSTVAALHLMNIYQPRITPAAACVVYCLEPLFATAFSLILGTESLAGATMAGGGVVLAAVLVVAWAERKPGSNHEGAKTRSATC